MLGHRVHNLMRYGCAVISIAVAIILRLMLDPVLGDAFPFATLFVGVLLTAWYGGFVPAMLSALIGGVSSVYFLLPPRGSFTPKASQEYFGLGLYLSVSLGIAILGGVMHAAQQRSAEAARAANYQAALIDQTHDAMLTWDWNGEITLWSRAAERLYGIPSAQAIGRNRRSLLPASVGDRLDSILEALEREGTWEGEIEHTNAAGQTLTVETRMALLREPGRNYVLETDRDITLRRKAEMALRELSAQLETKVKERTAQLAQSNEAIRSSERRLAGIVNSAMDAIVSLDGEQRIVLFNGAAEKMFEISASNAIGRPIDLLIPERFRQLHRRHIQGFGETGVTSRSMNSLATLYALRASGEEFPIEASISQIDVAGQKLFTVILRDITERSRAEQQVRSLNDELEQRVAARTAQLEAVNRELEAFSYSVSHDLRAPLRHINGFSLALLEDYADKLDEAGRGYLDELRDASAEMAELIDDLLMLARVTRTEMRWERVNLSDMAASVIAELRRQAPGRTLSVDIGEGLWVDGDKQLLRVLLTNLLGNAWKFTAGRERAEIKFGRCRENGETGFFVSDNGAGFDQAYAGRLFGAFQRLHTAAEFEGTGIGLATVQRVVHRHGGEVEARGEVGKGATFYFTLGNFAETDHGE